MLVRIFLALMVALGSVAYATEIHADAALDDGLMGWATRHPKGAPTGGAGGEVCVATDIQTFNGCFERMHRTQKLNTPFTIKIKGVIDGSTLADGSGYTRALLTRSNVSIVGINEGTQKPTLKAVWILATGEENLIVRNLRIIPGRDDKLIEPEVGCTVTDTDYCDWNPEPDALTVQGTQRVWIDHCEFSDGPDLNGANPYKSHYKTYDGLLDIKRGANYVTVSYSKFSNHDKSILIGHSDKQSSDNFHVTFYRNYFLYLGQRAPRVRYGKVHLLNNLYENQKKKDFKQKYHLTYAIGMGYHSQIISEKNVFDIKGASAKGLLDISDFSQWAQHFTDIGSWLNGNPTDLNTAAKTNINDKATAANSKLTFIGPATWDPSKEYPYTALNSPTEIRKVVLANAGVGIIEVQATK